jgi:hypothetical protein
MGRVNCAGEPEVVRAEPLGYYLRLWRKKYLAEHPRSEDDPQYRGAINQYRKATKSVPHFGATNWLAQETGIDKSVVGKICNAWFPHVALTKADKLLTTIDMPFLLYNEIEVIRNPNWPIKSYQLYMDQALYEVEKLSTGLSTPPVENAPELDSAERVC